MNITQWVATFFGDDKIVCVLVLIGVDLVLGVSAALKLGTFRLDYLANFARDDLLAKLVPYFVVYAASLAARQSPSLGSTAGFDDTANAVFGLIVAAMVGSIYKSLRDLGLNLPVPTLGVPKRRRATT